MGTQTLTSRVYRYGIFTSYVGEAGTQFPHEFFRTPEAPHCKIYKVFARCRIRKDACSEDDVRRGVRVNGLRASGDERIAR